jgi:hypothetical protein
MVVSPARAGDACQAGGTTSAQVKAKCDGLKGTGCSVTVQFTKASQPDGSAQTFTPVGADNMVNEMLTVPADADGVGLAASFDGKGADTVITLSCDFGLNFECAGNIGKGLHAACENNAPARANTRKARINVELNAGPPPKPSPPSKGKMALPPTPPGPHPTKPKPPGPPPTIPRPPM